MKWLTWITQPDYDNPDGSRTGYPTQLCIDEDIKNQSAAETMAIQYAGRISELEKALGNARIALTFYRGRMWEGGKPGTEYPFGMDAEESARLLLIDKAATADAPRIEKLETENKRLYGIINALCGYIDTGKIAAAKKFILGIPAIPKGGGASKNK